jgi:negative regulator of sigma E activity
MRRFASACAMMALAGLLPAAVMAAQPTPAPAAVPAADANASNALVREALEAPRHVSYVGQMQTIRWGMRVASATIQRVEHLAPSSTRRTFLAPEAMYGEYDITLGTTTTKIDPKQHRAMVSENPSSDNANSMNSNIALLAANYRALIGPVEIVAARPATTISLVNRYTGERVMRLWIDNDTKIVLAKEAYHQDGSLAWRSRFDEIRFTGEIPSGVFSATIPPGFQEVEGRRFADVTDDLARTLGDAGFKAVNPRYLPDGFHMIGAENSNFNGMRNLHLLYSDGIRSLSLFENNTNAEPDFGGVKPSITHFEGHDAEYVKDGPTTLLTWREHGLAFALIGDLDLNKLTAIAISVVP